MGMVRILSTDGNLLHECEAENVKEAVEDAVRSGVGLSGADLHGADLSTSNLTGADLRGACLWHCDLSWANLSGADLSSSDLSGADLSMTSLIGADLSGASLRNTNLLWANLSGATGLPSPRAFLSGFPRGVGGLIVYKRFDGGQPEYPTPTSWRAEPGSVLEEVVNSCRANDSGCGVSFGTLDWCRDLYTHRDLWACLIGYEDLAGVVVPYDTDGRARCDRLTLLYKVDPETGNRVVRSEEVTEMSTYFEGVLSRPPLVTNEIPDDTFDTSSIDLTGPCIYETTTGLSTDLDGNPCPTTRPPTRPSSRSPGKFMRSVLTALSTGLRRIVGGG